MTAAAAHPQEGQPTMPDPSEQTTEAEAEQCPKTHWGGIRCLLDVGHERSHAGLIGQGRHWVGWGDEACGHVIVCENIA